MARAVNLTLDGLVEGWAKATPSAPALTVFSGKNKTTLTYAQLQAQAEHACAQLAEAGVQPGDRVGLYLPKSARAVAALLGALRRGAAYVPVDPGAPPERLRFIVEHCGIKVVLSEGRPLAQLKKMEPPLDAQILEDAPEVEAAQAAPPRDSALAYVLYTSGSTGQPKGVAITHAQSLAFVKALNAYFALTPKDVLISNAPFNFDLSIIDLFCTFAAGGSVALFPESWAAFPAKVGQVLEQAGVTVWNSVPSALIQLTAKGKLETRELQLRTVMFAGEPYPQAHLHKLRDALPNARLYNVYGQTEANSSTVFAIPPAPAPIPDPLPIGAAFQNYEVLVVSEEGAQVTSPGVEGELYVVGNAVASGYYKDSERTQKAFVQHPLQSEIPQRVYKTGDRVKWTEDGQLVFCGRADHAIKVRGFRVELGEVEACAQGEAGVDRAVMVGVPDEEVGHRLVLFVQPEAAGFSQDALKARLAAHLPRYMLPEVVLSEAQLPKTGTGKINRKALLPIAQSALG